MLGVGSLLCDLEVELVISPLCDPELKRDTVSVLLTVFDLVLDAVAVGTGDADCEGAAVAVLLLCVVVLDELPVSDAVLLCACDVDDVTVVILERDFGDVGVSGSTSVELIEPDAERVAVMDVLPVDVGEKVEL